LTETGEAKSGTLQNTAIEPSMFTISDGIGDKKSQF
jgi:hypothetical protein